MVCALIAGAAILGVTTLERPFGDYFFYDYEQISYLHDEKTGKYVELGSSANFGSYALEVTVYDTPAQSQSIFSLRAPVIAIVSPTVGVKLEYDGECYFVKSNLRRHYDRIIPHWIDKREGQNLCFYVLMLNGTKVTRTEDIPLAPLYDF